MANSPSQLEMEPLRNNGKKDNKWSHIFHELSKLEDGNDEEEDPYINLSILKRFIEGESSFKLELKTGLPRHRLIYLTSQLKTYADANHDGKISSTEWKQWVDKSDEQLLGNTKIAGGFLRVLLYSPTYSCVPPTIFILSITLLQVMFYLLSLYSRESLGVVYNYADRQWLTCTPLIYNPTRRREAWRFITYMFLHGNHQHIIFNCLVQLCVGIPLEMSQPGWLGSLRVAGLYMSGVILGSLGASVVKPVKYLLGASGGVYALIFAHLATLILNWKEDGLIYTKRLQEAKDIGDTPLNLNPIIRGVRLAFVIFVVVFDISSALYKAFVLNEASSTSYAGHIFGAAAGLSMGVFLLKNRKVEDWEVIFQWIVFILFGIALCVCVIWHIAGTSMGWFPTEVWLPVNEHCVFSE